MKKVTNKSTVKVNYTGKLEDGTIFDSSLNPGREPLVAVLGEGQLIKGFENGLLEMSEGEKKTIEIEPGDAYGHHISDMTAEIPKDQVPENCSIGDSLEGHDRAAPPPVASESSEWQFHPMSSQKSHPSKSWLLLSY